MDSNTARLSAVGQIGVPVHDLEKATIFYRDTLGMDFIFQVPAMMSFFDCGGIRIMLTVPTSEEYDHPSSIIYYRVDDIQKTFAALTAQDVHFIQNPHSIGQIGNIDVWVAFFTDVDGNTLAIMSEIEVKVTE